MLKRFLLIAGCVFIFSILFTNQVIACSCDRIPNPPCRAYWNTSYIFDGVVTEFVSVENNSRGYENRRVKFKVEKIYKGDKAKEITVYTGDGRSDCGYPFKVGERYLVYSYGDRRYLTTNYCGRTRKLKYAKEDLDYFNNMSSMKSGGLIYGSIKKYALGYDDDENFGLVKPISNISVKIRGTKEYDVKSDENGNFKILNVPKGQYLIEATLPKKLRFSVHTPRRQYISEVNDKKCIEANFYVDFEGEVNGKVLDKLGNPVEGVYAQLVSADYKFESKDDTAPLLEWTLTKSDGSFRFTGIPSGRYFVGVGIGGAKDVFGKNGRVFYPNINDPSKAYVIELLEGKKTPHFILTLPEKKQ